MIHSTGRRGRILLAVSSTLLCIFLALLYFQSRREQLTRFTPDDELLAELAAATLEPEEELPPREDWPQWRGARRDGVVSAANLALDWPAKGPPPAWQKKIGEGYGSFAVADGRFYTLVREDASEVALCGNLDTGEEIWRYAYDCPYSSGQGSGPRSTPCLAKGKLYTVGATCVFHCLNATDGSVLWKHDLLGEFQAPNIEFGVSFSPTTEGKLLLTNPGGPKNGSVAAFDKEKGDLVWNTLDDPAGYSSPMAATIGGVRQIIYFTGVSLVGIAADKGTVLWRFPWITAYNINAATPILLRAVKDGQPLQYVFISSNYGKGCALLKIEGNRKAGFQARPVYEGTQMKNHFSTAVRRGEHIYGFDDTNLTCMSLRTGEVAWKKSGFYKGSLLRVGDDLLILGETGKVALAAAEPSSYQEKASFSALRRRCWTMPILADGRLLLRDEEQVKCYDLRAK